MMSDNTESTETVGEPEAAASSRDYLEEMGNLIDKWTGGDRYSARLVANELVQWLFAHDPDLLQGYLVSRAEEVVYRVINDKDRSKRAHTRQVSSRGVFAAHVDAYEHGDTAAIADWLATKWTITPGETKSLRSMTADDLTTSANGYTDRAKQAAMNAVFLRAIAAQVGTGTVEDRYTNTQLQEMWRSLGNNDD